MTESKRCIDCYYSTRARGLSAKRTEDHIWCTKHQNNQKDWSYCDSFLDHHAVLNSNIKQEKI